MLLIAEAPWPRVTTPSTAGGGGGGGGGGALIPVAVVNIDRFSEKKCRSMYIFSTFMHFSGEYKSYILSVAEGKLYETISIVGRLAYRTETEIGRDSFFALLTGHVLLVPQA